MNAPDGERAGNPTGRRRSFVATRQDGHKAAKPSHKPKKSPEKPRTQTARHQDAPEIRAPGQARADDDDLPILTEVVHAEEEREREAFVSLQTPIPEAPVLPDSPAPRSRKRSSRRCPTPTSKRSPSAWPRPSNSK